MAQTVGKFTFHFIFFATKALKAFTILKINVSVVREYMSSLKLNIFDWLYEMHTSVDASLWIWSMLNCG